MQTAPQIGILMLETRFPRVLGDIGNRASFDFDVSYRVVPGATPEAIVCGDSRAWTEAFIRAGKDLVDSGCRALATTCGFLTLVRDDVERACGVPVASSALEQIPALRINVPPQKAIGILTISAGHLTQAHLAAAGVSAQTPVEGLDGGQFAHTILTNQTTLATDTAEAEMVAAAHRLCARHPHVAAIVLECTNMPPYAAAVSRATGRPVYSILTYLNSLHDRLVSA